MTNKEKRRLATHELPDRDTPDAVILLGRLSRAGPVDEEQKPLESTLTDIAGVINARLPIETRVSPGDPRLREPISRKWDLTKFATSVLSRYIVEPADHAAILERSHALIALRQSFVWCHGLWTEYSRDADTRAKVIGNGEDTSVNPVDDPEALSMGIGVFWLASLCPVLDGWEALALPDAEIERRLVAGGSPDSPDSHRNKLERVRRFAASFRHTEVSDDDLAIMLDKASFMWAAELHLELERFFRAAFVQRNKVGPESVTAWVRGSAKRSSAFDHLKGLVVTPAGARERLMAMLLDPTREGAKRRFSAMWSAWVAGEDRISWISAVIALRDEGVLSPDEAVYFMYQAVLTETGEGDAEAMRLHEQMLGIEKEHGIGDDFEAALDIPEWALLCERHEERLNFLRASILGEAGAHDAAALLEQSPDDFNEAADRGRDEYHSRWSDTGTLGAVSNRADQASSLAEMPETTKARPLHDLT